MQTVTILSMDRPDGFLMCGVGCCLLWRLNNHTKLMYNLQSMDSINEVTHRERCCVTCYVIMWAVWCCIMYDTDCGTVSSCKSIISETRRAAQNLILSVCEKCRILLTWHENNAQTFNHFAFFEKLKVTKINEAIDWLVEILKGCVRCECVLRSKSVSLLLPVRLFIWCVVQKFYMFRVLIYMLSDNVNVLHV